MDLIGQMPSLDELEALPEPASAFERRSAQSTRSFATWDVARGIHGPMFKAYDRIVIVSLPERTDRRRVMRAQLRKFGLAADPRVSFFDAYRFEDPGPFRKAGSHGCYHSHLEILRDAALANESVLILQDDCGFLREAATYDIPAGTDIFYGGYSASNPEDPHGSEIVGAHCMGFSAWAAKKAWSYLSKLLDPSFPPDPVAAATPGFDPRIRPPIDGACVWFRRAHPELRTEFKHVAYQRSTRSDVSPSWLDNIAAMRPVLATVRFIKHMFPELDDRRWRPAGSKGVAAPAVRITVQDPFRAKNEPKVSRNFGRPTIKPFRGTRSRQPSAPMQLAH